MRRVRLPYLERPQYPADVGQIPEKSDTDDVSSDDAQGDLLGVANREIAALDDGVRACGEADSDGSFGDGGAPSCAGAGKIPAEEMAGLGWMCRSHVEA